MELFFKLFIGHALADYPLQGDFLSKLKSRRFKVIDDEGIWFLSLIQHASIHAGFVWLFTSSALLAMWELIAHTIIDYLKCEKKISYIQDQLLHVACKLLWAFLFWLGVK